VREQKVIAVTLCREQRRDLAAVSQIEESFPEILAAPSD